MPLDNVASFPSVRRLSAEERGAILAWAATISGASLDPDLRARVLRAQQPDGSFWIKHTDALGILKSQGSFVLSNIRGFPQRELPNYGFQAGGLR